MFHVQHHSPTKQAHGRSAGLLRSASPRKKHAHRLGDGEIAGSAALGGHVHGNVPVKPTQRASSKPTLGKTIDAPTAKALFGGADGNASTSSKAAAFTTTAGPSNSNRPNKKNITTPPSNVLRSNQLPSALMTSPRRALGDKTNASPQRNLVELPEVPVWKEADFAVQHPNVESENSVEQPVLKGILTSTALTDEELDEICSEHNRGDSARNPPEERPEAFADFPPSSEAFSILSRNFQAMLLNHFCGSPVEPILHEYSPLDSIMGDAVPTSSVKTVATRPASKAASRPATGSTASRMASKPAKTLAPAPVRRQPASTTSASVARPASNLTSRTQAATAPMPQKAAPQSRHP